MQSVREHYASHLAPIYAWMSGGAEAALVGDRSGDADETLTLAGRDDDFGLSEHSVQPRQVIDRPALAQRGGDEDREIPPP